MNWSRYMQEFSRDGSLRDLYVFQTSLLEWQRLIDGLRNSPYVYSFTRDGDKRTLPTDVEDIFVAREQASFTLAIQVSGLHIHCHFFGEQEIEFDMDPRELNIAEQLEGLFRFMRLIADLLLREVVLTEENSPQAILFRARPGMSEVEHVA